MDEVSLQNNYVKFIASLVTSLRKTSLYPLKHPVVVSSIKEAHSTLRVILSAKDALNVSLSADNKILIEDSLLSGESSSLAVSLAPYFKKLNIENLTFTSGIAEKELEEFIKILIADAEEIKNISDINKEFSDRGIKKIKADQFSYIKVQKDKEMAVVEQGPSFRDELKSKIKNFSLGKIQAGEIEAIEKELFGIIAGEFKENNKLSASTKSVFKKFILHTENKEGSLERLRNALIDFGCQPSEVDGLIGKMSGEISKRPGIKPVRQAQPLPEEAESLKRENEDLRLKIRQLQAQIESDNLSAGELRRKVIRLSDEREKIDNIIHHMADGLVVIDAEGRVLMANPTAESLLGIGKQDIGKPLKERVAEEHLLTLVKNLSSDKEAPVQKDIELFSPNESTKKVLRTSSAVIEDNNGNTVGMVTILNDITKQKEMENLKDMFLANVSHELRTPLVAIEKSISLILSKAAGEIPETQNQFLAIAQRNLKRLTLLINDLLDLSKLEAGKMQLSFENSPVEKIINESVETFNTWAKTKLINIEKNVQAGLPEVFMDPNRIIQVLNNLISNALKFTFEKGKILVAANLNPQSRTLEISVEDNGVGMTKESLEKIFDKFYQVGEKIQTEVRGTGIGLSIAREIVELHGGKIWVESQKGKGTKFTFALPLNKGAGSPEDGNG